MVPDSQSHGFGSTMQLDVIEGPDAGKCFRIDEGETLKIGRGQASDTRLGDPHMSRVHCVVEVADGIARVSDNQSTSGTFFRGEKVADCELKSGDTIQVGESTLRYSHSTPSESATIGGTSSEAVGKEKKPRRLQDLLGEQLGDYRLEEIVTHGNSGMLFRGTDTVNDRPVAVKVLTPNLEASEEQKDRFVRAMQTMLPIQHPNIVQLYNAGKKGPFCWCAMEFIEGEGLTEMIDRIGIEGMLDWKEVWRIGMHIATALYEAHERKIIHRNVTPANLMRRKDKTCVLGDLMLAKGMEGVTSRQVTQPGQIMGDLPYLPPERTDSESTVDTRSDLYGLGATMYALLTGRPPVSGDSLTELLESIREVVPANPKAFQLSVNDLFADLVMKLIEKNPDDRFQTPGALIKDLDRIGNYNNLKL